MKFEVFHPGLLGRTDVVAVDTVHRPGLWGPCFTHHRPHNNHPRYAADTSTAGVLRFLSCEDRSQLAGHTITTNHFDADALLPVWALLHPEEALERRALLESVARCGDFFLCTDGHSLRVNLALESLHLRVRGRGGRGERHVEDDVTRECFAQALPKLRELLDRPESYFELWDAPLRRTEEDLHWLQKAGHVTELWDRHTSLVEADRELEGHALNSVCKNDLLLVWPRGGGEVRLDVRPALGWYELPSMPHGPRYDLEALAARLKEADPDGGWRHEPGPVRVRAAGSGLRQAQVLDVIADWLTQDRGVAEAYRTDVKEVFRHWPVPAVQRSHERFLGAPAVRHAPGGGHGGLHPLSEEAGSGWQRFVVSDDFYWNRRDAGPLELMVRVHGSAESETRVDYDAWGEARRAAWQVKLVTEGQESRATFSLESARLAATQDGADLRVWPGSGRILELELRAPA